MTQTTIFFMESFFWESDFVRSRFGISKAQARETKELAFNQGFYNLFLAIGIAAGLIIGGGPGGPLALFSLGFVVLAAVVLVANDRSKLRAAITQGLAPLLALIVFFAFVL